MPRSLTVTKAIYGKLDDALVMEEIVPLRRIRVKLCGQLAHSRRELCLDSEGNIFRPILLFLCHGRRMRNIK